MCCGVVLWGFRSEWRETFTCLSPVSVPSFSVPDRRVYRSFIFDETVAAVLVAFFAVNRALFWCWLLVVVFVGGSIGCCWMLFVPRQKGEESVEVEFRKDVLELHRLKNPPGSLLA